METYTLEREEASMSYSTGETVGGKIRLHPLPPDGFNPRAASPLELRRYGLPQRPDPAIRPQLAARWDHIFSRRLTYITPTFRSMDELLPGVQHGRSRQDLVTFPHPTWSGAVVHASGSEAFTWVLGQWNVPDVAPPAGGKGSWYSFAWIGIDGTADVTQIGTVQSVSADASGSLSKYCYAVYEWWPNSWKVITNLPVNFGDTMLGLICMDSPTEAFFNLLNLTSGMHAGFTFTAPARTVSSENQAEWILERPEIGNSNPPLPNFGEIYFDSAMGGHGLDFLADGGTDTVLNIVVNGITMATTTVETPTLIKIAYTGAPPFGTGQLLSYGDDGTPGNVSDPVVVGFGGWLEFEFLFAGQNVAGENRIYAVNQNGQLLSYGDAGTPGNVSDPVVVGFGGWLEFGFLLAGENAAGENRIYAVNQNGQLLSYGDSGTPGNVSDPVVVGFGGWLEFKFLFAGRNLSGENRIYAVDQTGQLLSYGDSGTPGNVSDPVVVGFGGWLEFKFLFAGRNLSGENRIYAVDQNGQLLSYWDAGTPGNVSDPVVVGLPSWLEYKFLFGGENVSGENRIYAVVA
jgi:negative regulator of replication initiation